MNQTETPPSTTHASAAPEITPDAVKATSLPGLLRGMTYQTPTIGTIRIGGTEIQDGETVPVQDDHFTVSTRFRDDTGSWVKHRTMTLLEEDPLNLVNTKLRRIPVRIVYDNPNLNMGEQYAAFTSDQRPACVGNGATAKQAGGSHNRGMS